MLRECKPGGYFSNPGLRVWRPSNPGTRVPGFDVLSESWTIKYKQLRDGWKCGLDALHTIRDKAYPRNALLKQRNVT